MEHHSFQDYLQALRALTLPRDDNGAFAKCREYDIDVNSIIDQVIARNRSLNVSLINDFVSRNRWNSVKCRNGYDYDEREYPETLATKVGVDDVSRWHS